MSARIVGLSLLAAFAYGIAQDQITARICLEYFTVAHPPVFHTDSPTLIALGWGVLATWWTGALLGIALALSSRLGSRPKLGPRDLVAPIGVLLAIMACASTVSGVVGYVVAREAGAVPPGMLGMLIAPARHARFFADWRAHQAAYATGILGGIGLCVWAIRRRAQLAPGSEEPGASPE